jgi:outer membrane protein
MTRTVYTLLFIASTLGAAAQNTNQPQTVVDTAPTTQMVALTPAQNTTPAQTTTPATSQAAALRYGYLSVDSVLHSLPDYTIAKHKLSDLKAKYDAEMKRVEDEFNTKYQFFLQDQQELAPSILQKRQAELQELMDKNVAFKAKARQLLQEAEEEAMSPIRDKVNTAIRLVGEKRGLAFVLNTDNNAAPFLNPTFGEDITAAVLQMAQ